MRGPRLSLWIAWWAAIVAPVAVASGGEPPIEAVQEAAVRYIDCAPAAIRALGRDARAFGALPDVQLEGSVDKDRQTDLDAFDQVEGLSDDAGWELSVELQWDLADLVTSYERIRTLSEQQRRMELRQRVLEDVTRCYYDRLRAVAELEMTPDLEPLEREQLRIRIDELTAHLDAMTGGEYREMLDEPRRRR